MNTTIIYCTSNKEKPQFEEKIRENLLKVCGDIPIVSVSQKPIDLGKNICVGEVGASNFNQFRQIQIACREAKTPFVVTAEADCLYPPDYFEVVPEDESKCYRNTNIYILRRGRDFFNQKSSSVFSQIIGRQFYLDRLEELFDDDAPEWDENNKKWPNQPLFKSWEEFETKNPCISLKTGRGMRITSSHYSEETHSLPYWGTVENLKANYL